MMCPSAVTAAPTNSVEVPVFNVTRPVPLKDVSGAPADVSRTRNPPPPPVLAMTSLPSGWIDSEPKPRAFAAGIVARPLKPKLRSWVPSGLNRATYRVESV